MKKELDEIFEDLVTGFNFDHARKEIEVLINKARIESRQKSYEAIHAIHMAHDWNEISQDLKDWLQKENHDLTRKLKELKSKQKGDI